MDYKGIETENYTEGQFLQLPRMGRKSLIEAKAMGAKFRLPVESDFDPTRGGVYIRSKVRRDRDEDGWFTAIPKLSQTRAEKEQPPTDPWGNPLDGDEMI